MLTPLNLAHVPTPLHRLDRISGLWEHEIWIKRDDQTGSGLSGNKVRKLEYLLADALEQHADTIISCGAVQSNHCRATSIASARLGLSCHLLLRGEESSNPDGNLLLDHITGAHINYITEEEYYADLPARLKSMAAEVQNDGGRPYIIVEGGSDSVGAWGYVEAANEAREQCERAGFQPDRIILATGSGGTHAGLLVGVRRLGWDVEIISASVCYDSKETSARIFNIIRGMQERFKVGLNLTLEHIKILDNYRGSGYGQAGSNEMNVILEMARAEGILLDPTYTCKAARAIKIEAKEGRFTGSTLFWHTGGMFGLFPYRDELNQLIGQTK